MAVASRGRTDIHKWRDNNTRISPERTKVWIEPKNEHHRRVPVVYYLSKNGHLQHPHFIEVSLSSNDDGLYLRDVINRLNNLRGKGMASKYSWSSKRSYKNGFVWQDLSEEDFIYPAHGHEYVLKGSELLETSLSFRSPEKVPETHKSGENSEFPVALQRRNQSWSSIDLHEYKVYKAESTGEYAGKGSDAATQTEEKRRRQRRLIREDEDNEEEEEEEEKTPSFATELTREEISPPPSSSSSETLESLIKADNNRISSTTNNNNIIINESDIRNLTADNQSSGRVKASVVLKQLISCGSFADKECEVTSTSRRYQGLSLTSHYRTRLQQEVLNHVGSVGNPSSRSLMETKKDHEFSAFKRSTSSNGDRSSKLEFEKDVESIRDERVQSRKPKMTSKKEGENNILREATLHGSKRLSNDRAC